MLKQPNPNLTLRSCNQILQSYLLRRWVAASNFPGKVIEDGKVVGVTVAGKVEDKIMLVVGFLVSRSEPPTPNVLPETH